MPAFQGILSTSEVKKHWDDADGVVAMYSRWNSEGDGYSCRNRKVRSNTWSNRHNNSQKNSGRSNNSRSENSNNRSTNSLTVAVVVGVVAGGLI